MLAEMHVLNLNKKLSHKLCHKILIKKYARTDGSPLSYNETPVFKSTRKGNLHENC